ncbi:RNA polymerase sigma-70 factor [Pedobacter punctiformis]|uniref:RNA polymerase sigma-70 factor n=1 Tax=Pedobacter punctiformis TaxID=3004097 RepID=A0ABT4LC42_9SPHI|nr:RNA polymerase sigma-70 factor [Pedobacter sp. HCMS5-2]MCZ4245282.1 RNA polymerase sigma-70 factor [Pedobacter sp. HCMS5-2]
MESNDTNLIALIKEGNKLAFDDVFIKHFKSLHAYAYTIIKERDDAEEIVQNVFVRIWTKRAQLKTDGYLKSFLYRAVHNESLNYLKHKKIRSKFDLHYADSAKNDMGNLNKDLMAAELERNIHAAINDLPEKCREVFQLSRFEQLKYQQIADALNISIKTVENQMGKALKILRLKMVDFLIFLFIYLM